MTQQTAGVITRFAPSPTGFLHIGGARTALFNWLFARKHGGKFLLRIEDTDRERSTNEAVTAILEGMQWLGLDWDGDAISQFGRSTRHAEIAHTLLAAGHVYECFATADELSDAREKARADGQQFRGDIWRNRDPSEAPAGRAPTLRLKMPRDGSTVIEDSVQGRVEVENSVLDDMVLLRSDGTPTYMLAVVVDDHDMGVTNVIRGDDHLNNSFRQAALYRAMNWDLPTFGHIPLIHGPDGKKLSKRHGALGVDAYREMGFLPEAMRNYLLRLGWSHGDDEIISTDQAISWFNLEAIGGGASRFDFDKLDSLNAHYLRAADPAFLVAETANGHEARLGRPLTREETARLTAALPSLLERAKRLPDLVQLSTFFCNTAALDLDDKAKKAVASAADIFAPLADGLAGVSNWSGEAAKTVLADYADQTGLKLGKVMQPVRAALTGGVPSGDLSDLLEILGQTLVVARLKEQA